MRRDTRIGLFFVSVFVLGILGGFALSAATNNLTYYEVRYYEHVEKGGNETYTVADEAVAEELRVVWRETVRDGLEAARCVKIKDGVIESVELPTEYDRKENSVYFECSDGNTRLHTHQNNVCLASSPDFYSSGYNRVPYMIVGCGLEDFMVYYYKDLKYPSKVIFE